MKNCKPLFRLLFLCLVLNITTTMLAKDTLSTRVLNQVWQYAATIQEADTLPRRSFSYQRFYLHVKHRNILLMAVPDMYPVARRGPKEFVGESLNLNEQTADGKMHVRRLLDVNTIRHGRRTLETTNQHLLPTIYGETMVADYILSPFYRSNRRFYHYKVSMNSEETMRIDFHPRAINTQLIRGWATIDAATGRVIDMEYDGDYDMIRFHMYLLMGSSGSGSLMPDYCRLTARFRFLGNDVQLKTTVHYNLPAFYFADRERNAEQVRRLMNRLRPDRLSEEETRTLSAYYDKLAQDKAADQLKEQQMEDSLALAADSLNTERPLFSANTYEKIKDEVWDMVNGSLLNKIQTNFGNDNRGSVRLSPIFNPLYLRYSGNKGVTYKFDARSSYALTDNSNLSARLKASYSFKQKQLYLQIPLRWNYNLSKNGFVGIDFSSGDRVFDSKLMNDVIQEQGDSVDWERTKIDYFRDYHVVLHNNHDLTEKWSYDVGLSLHYRKAVNSPGLAYSSFDDYYQSSAPTLSIQYRPGGWNGPALTFSYERSIKGLLHSNMAYERWEFDCSYKRKLKRLRTLSFRAGTGFYTKRGAEKYFLDYTNFRENNIPNGWDDDWTGEFELLKSEWYNASQYYERVNFTYESPLLALSRIPFIGRYIEMERIYLSALSVKAYTPYTEIGFGLTTRWLSMAAFIANKRGEFEGFGCKFELELFRKW